jgi:hypothetical protein
VTSPSFSSAPTALSALAAGLLRACWRRRRAGFDHRFSLRRHPKPVDGRLIPNRLAVFLHLETNLRFFIFLSHRLKQHREETFTPFFDRPFSELLVFSNPASFIQLDSEKNLSRLFDFHFHLIFLQPRFVHFYLVRTDR